MPLNADEANSILQSMTARIEQCLPTPAPTDHPDADRHRITVLSRFAACADRLVNKHASLAPSRPAVDSLLLAGQKSSAAIPHRCSACLNLYHHTPPDTTTKLCADCRHQHGSTHQ